MNNTPENAKAFMHDTGQYTQPHLLNDPNQQLPYHPYPSYPTSYPAYYLAPIPGPPPVPEPYPPLPPGARMLSPPRPPTSDELKYKCNICGKIRSPRFHFKHPIPPGHFPAQTICRKCRQTGTDSEDTSEEQPRFRRVRRSKSVVSISEPFRSLVMTEDDDKPLRRKLSRVALVSRSRSRHRGRIGKRSISSSSSLDSDELDALEEVRRRNGRSRSVGRMIERVRYIEESPPRRVSPPRKTIYIEEERVWRGGRASRYEDDDHTEYDSEVDYVPRRRMIARAPSVTRISRRQYSDPFVREHVRFSTRDYFDGPNSVSEASSTMEGAARPRSTMASDLHVMRVSEEEARRIRKHLATSDEYELVADRPAWKSHHDDQDWREEGSRRSRRERRHGRRRESGHDESDYERIEGPGILPRVPAPTPPPAGSRRLRRHSISSRHRDEEMVARRTSPRATIERRGRPAAVGAQPRSGSRTRSGSRWDAPFGGRPPMPVGESSTIRERIQGGPANEDYDWYDNHGQRVRVREI